jgi:DNA polymerase-1
VSADASPPSPIRPTELYLIDGNSLVYRAFFALPESIATSTGFPTNAIFGFASMLVKLITDHGVKPTIVVWDRGSSGRKEVYTEYKGHRPSKPDLLAEQYPHMEPLVDAFGYTNYGVDGFEADDVIATLTEQAKAQDISVTIVTGDRDIFQLVDDNVRVMATARGITETKLYGPQEVLDRYGIAHTLIPDFYGLKGDTSDNIPGVPGIGDKTAAQLLQKFGTLERILDSVDEISGAKRQQNLREFADDARVSKVLATAQREVPGVDLDLEVALAREPDRSRLREVFREFELRDPLRRLEEALGDPDEAAPPPAADVSVAAEVREGTLDDLSSLEGELALVVVEGEAAEGELLPAAPLRFAVAADGGAVVIGGAGSAAEVVTALGDRPVIAHDAKALGQVPAGLTHDTMIAAYLLEPARRGYPLRELVEERGLAADAGDPLAADAARIAPLAAWQREQILDRGLSLLMRDVEMPLVSVLRQLEREGVRLNTERLGYVAERVHGELRDLEDDIYGLAGDEFTIGSPQQLGEILFVKLGLTKKRRGKTGFSTDARVLQQIRDEHPIVPKIERWRELNQLAKTYLDVLPQLVDEESRLHTTFLQGGATTGRLASTNPNLQNVPVRTPLGREIRGCFEAAPGHILVSADYSQVELRVLAHVADEPVLKEIFVRGEDVHTATASRVFQKAPEDLTPMDRSKAKMINYGIVYGLSDYGLAERLNIPREEAKEVIDTYLARFPAVAAFMAAAIESAKELGYVTTIYGRRRQIPELRARNYQVRSLGERLAVNTVIQGTSADVIKLAMIGAARALEPMKSRMVLTIHDELLFEGPPEEEEALRELVEREMLAPWEDRDPPLAVDVGSGRTWLEAK